MAILTSQRSASETAQPQSVACSPVRSKVTWQRLLNEAFFVVLITAGVLCAFGKTVFSAVPISRLYQLGQRDSLFAQYYSGAREGYDASVYQYFLPNHVYTVQSLLCGHIPLWNPLTGCGAPHLADIETAVLWPARILLLAIEPIRAWNLLLVLNLVVFGTGTFVLARVLGLSRLSAMCAGLVLSFCPYLIFQSELIGGCSSLTPWVMASFTTMALSDKFIWRIVASLACAVMVVSGHPEPVFFGISVACILRLCFAITLHNNRLNKSTLPENDLTTQNDEILARNRSLPPSKYRLMANRLLKACGDIAMVGGSSLGLTAFVLLPFVELLLNSECYKLGLEGWSFGVPLNTVLVNLIHPAYGSCSPYIGIAVPVMMVLALFTAMKRPVIVGLFLALAIALALMCRIGPLEGLLTWKALSWFVPKYSWPSVLILCSVLAAFGLERFIYRREENPVSADLSAQVSDQPGPALELRGLKETGQSFDSMETESGTLLPGTAAGDISTVPPLNATRRSTSSVKLKSVSAVGAVWQAARFHRSADARAIVIAISSIAVALVLCKFCPALLQSRPMDEAFDHLVVQNKAWVRDLILLAILSSGVAGLWMPARLRTIFITALVSVCTAVSLGSSVKLASPPRPVIRYDTMAPIPFLQSSHERMVSMGRHVLCPDTNLAYSIANIVPVNVYHPTRFQTFMKKAGVTHEGVNEFFDGRLSKFIDMASVKYAVSPLPVLATEEMSGEPREIAVTERPSWTLVSATNAAAVKAEGVVLEAGALRLFVENSEVIGRLRFSAPSSRAGELAWQAVLLDDKNQVIWFGDLERLEYMFAAKTSSGVQSYTKDVAVAIPCKLQQDSVVTLAVQMFDWRTKSYVNCPVPPYKSPDKLSLVPIASFIPSGAKLSTSCKLEVTRGELRSRHFRLVSENEGRIRVYENVRALPAAYIVHSARYVHDGQQALKLLESPGFDHEHCAVLEVNPATSVIERQPGADSKGQVAVNSVGAKCSISRPDSNTVLIKCQQSRPGFLVLTDTFYPGWQARLVQDGISRELPVLRANYLFRAVCVPAGKYTIEFRYAPLTVFGGAAISVLTLLILAFLAIREFLHSKSRRN